MEGCSGSWWEKMINSTTISDDDIMIVSGAQYNSLSAYKSLLKLSDSSGELYTTNLNHGEDVVDALYRLSEAFDHRRLVSIDSATDYVSDVLFHDQDGSHAHTGVFEIISLSLQCLADEDGRPCRNKAACSVILTADKGNTFESTSVNSLIANGPIEIIAEVEREKSARESSSSAVAAGDGNINPTTTTTGSANDQDKKSPSEEDI